MVAKPRAGSPRKRAHPIEERTAEYYLLDLGHLLLERAIEAREECDEKEDSEFDVGRRIGFYEVVSLMRGLAASMDIPLRRLKMQSIDTGRLLLGTKIGEYSAIPSIADQPPMPDRTAERYLRCLGRLLRARAQEAKEARRQSGGASFETGRLFAYHETISIMQQQAIGFRIALAAIGLAGLDPEKDLM